MSTRILGPVLLLALWFASWGDISWANLASGLVVVGIVLFMIRTPANRDGFKVHLIPLLRLVFTLAFELVAGSTRVALAVVAPTERRLRSSVVDVRLEVDRPFTVTVVADLLSLVPGSLAIDTEGGPPHITVHVMGESSIETVEEDVARLERLTVAAFEPLEESAQ